MPKKSRVSDKARTEIINRSRKREPVSVIARELKLSVPYIYKILREAKDSAGVVDIADLDLDAAIDAKRTVINSYYQCVNRCRDEKGKLKTFVRYSGEDKKVFCSAECYYHYQTRTFPPKAEVRSPIFTPVDTKEYQEIIYGTNAVFFPVKAEENVDLGEMVAE